MVMSMCRVISCVVGRGCLWWPVCSLDKTVSLCPASFCTSKPNFPITPGISWLPTFAFQSPMMKRTSFLSVSSRRSCGFYLFYFWPQHTACRIFVLRLEVETSAVAVAVQRGPNHWTPPPPGNSLNVVIKTVYIEKEHKMYLSGQFISLSVAFITKICNSRLKGLKQLTSYRSVTDQADRYFLKHSLPKHRSRLTPKGSL